MLTIKRIKYYISRYLCNCGIFPSFVAYDYYIEAIFDKIAFEGEIFSISNRVYQKLADEFGVSICSVERSMRYAVSKVMILEMYNRITGANVQKPPTVKEFIFNSADYVKKWLGIY